MIRKTVKAATRRVSESLGKRLGYAGFISDFTAAFFTQGELNYDLWCELPNGRKDYLPGQKRDGRICRKLKKLVQGAPRGWYEHLARELEAMGYIRSKADPCWFLKYDPKDGQCIASFPVHVDDGKGRVRLDWCDTIEKELKERFKLGEFKWTD